MPRPTARHEDTRQVRVMIEDDTKHVPHLTLIPVGRREDVRDGGQRELILIERYLKPDVCIPLKREEVIDDREGAWWLPITMNAPALVDRRHVIQHRVWIGNTGTKCAYGFMHIVL